MSFLAPISNTNIFDFIRIELPHAKKPQDQPKPSLPLLTPSIMTSLFEQVPKSVAVLAGDEEEVALAILHKAAEACVEDLSDIVSNVNDLLLPKIDVTIYEVARPQLENVSIENMVLLRQISTSVAVHCMSIYLFNDSIPDIAMKAAWIYEIEKSLLPKIGVITEQVQKAAPQFLASLVTKRVREERICGCFRQQISALKLLSQHEKSDLLLLFNNRNAAIDLDRFDAANHVLVRNIVFLSRLTFLRNTVAELLLIRGFQHSVRLVDTLGDFRI